MKRPFTNLLRSKIRRHRAKSRAFARTFEVLEDRQMMTVSSASILTDPIALFPAAFNTPAATLMAGINNNTLYIRGTDAGETITLRQQNNAIRIDGLSASFNINSFQNIILRSFGGNDKIYLNSESVSGQQAITRPTEIMAGSGNDEITGSMGKDAIFGEAGADKVWGNGGNDFIDGGSGDDQLHGDAGHDYIFGDIGNDKLWGDDGNDYLLGGDGTDYLYGGKGIDNLDGSLGNDFLYGEADYDYLQDDVATKSDKGSNFIGTGYPFVGWFDRFLQDASLRTAARYAYAPDFAVSRTEMINIFDAAKDGGTVDSIEFGDLQRIVATVGPSMPDYVRFLADKVVNGDRANNWYQGGSLGNLAPGSSDIRLELLVDKWFFGKDHPAAEYKEWDSVANEWVSRTGTYKYVQGELVQNGISYTDISQGHEGDCYFMAALGSLALRNSTMIENMFIVNGDDTFTVRFYKNGTPQYVTVDRYLPTTGGYRVFASFGDYGATKDDATNELWVALAEKAYAQINESGWISQDDTNSYQGIWGGEPRLAMMHLTGEHAAFSSLSRDQVMDKLNSGKLLTANSKGHPADDKIYANHSFTVVGYNIFTDRFILYNPWGFDRYSNDIDEYPVHHYLTWDEVSANFGSWDYT